MYSPPEHISPGESHSRNLTLSRSGPGSNSGSAVTLRGKKNPILDQSLRLRPSLKFTGAECPRRRLRESLQEYPALFRLCANPATSAGGMNDVISVGRYHSPAISRLVNVFSQKQLARHLWAFYAPDTGHKSRRKTVQNRHGTTTPSGGVSLQSRRLAAWTSNTAANRLNKSIGLAQLMCFVGSFRINPLRLCN